MIRDLFPRETLTNVRDGNGTLYRQIILQQEEMLGHGTIFAKFSIPPGCSIGLHQHKGGSEWYFVLSGSGSLLGAHSKKNPIKAGQLALLDELGMHGIENDGDECLEIIALGLQYQQSSME